MARDLNAKFYVGHVGKDSDKLLGNGNFRKYNDAVAKPLNLDLRQILI